MRLRAIAAYEAGRTVVLLSRRDCDLRAFLAAIADRVTPVHFGSFRIGDRRTVTFMSQSDPAPLTYWVKETPGERWVWACRACGATDQRWTWRDVDESTPMRRQLLNFTDDDGPVMVDVPWSCPRSGCHGAPQWQRISAAA